MRTKIVFVMGLVVAGCSAPEDLDEEGALGDELQLDHPGPTCTEGCITEFPAPSPGRVFGLVAGPDGAIWFPEPRVSRLARLALDGATSELAMLTPYTDPAAQGFVGVGPDGRSLSFNERFRIDATPGKIGRVSVPRDDVPADQAVYEMTEYDLPRWSCAALGFAAGPDGNMWFTEVALPGTGITGAVGKITADGVITEYLLPGITYALGIAAGPDGAMWFVENNVHRIGRITMDGQLTEYPLPWAGAALRITAGDDGALWFSDPGASGIGRITVDGDASLFPVPGGTSPVGIVAGPDKAIWFTAFTGNAIMRMNLAGAVTHRFAIPTPNSVPFAVTVGPDRNLWFTETATNQIGRLRLHDDAD